VPVTAEYLDGALAALLSGHHVLIVGPPGTAKSMLADELCRRLDGATYFQWLMTKFTTPEELLLWVGRLLHALGVTLDVEIPEAWSDPSLAPQPFVASGAHLGHLHMAKPDGLRLGEILVQMLILDAPDVARALKFQEETGCRLGEALVMLGLITQKGLEAALRIQQRKRGPRD
jgi:DNA polymerase III delta prime subunit